MIKPQIIFLILYGIGLFYFGVIGMFLIIACIALLLLALDFLIHLFTDTKNTLFAIALLLLLGH